MVGAAIAIATSCHTLIEVSNVPGASSRALIDWCLDSLTGPNSGMPDDEINLSKLTVVVPSRNRQDYLLRQLRYWYLSSARLIVVDGSTHPLGDRVRSAFDNHERMTYLHERSSLADRFNLVSGLIETPYAVMLGDDEFHVPTGLKASLDVLEENQDLVGCMGQVLSFSPVGLYRRVVFARAYSLLHGYSIRQTASADRLNAAMSVYNMATCYAVLRTTVWQKSWGEIGDWGAGGVAELQQAMAVYLLGGLATTGHVQLLRSIENPPGYPSSAARNRKIWFPEWWQDQLYEAECSAFVSSLVESVADDLGVDHDECAAWVMTGAKVFVNGNSAEFEFPDSSESLFGRLVDVAARLLRTVARCLPNPLFLAIKRWRGCALRLLGRPGGNYYGTFENLSRIFKAEGLVVVPGTVDEIASVEVMVREFHELRSGKPDGT